MTDLDPVQQALAAEHAAIYVLGVCAAQTSFSAQRALWRRLDEAVLQHRVQRDHLAEVVRALGGEPVAAAAAYEVPERLGKSRLVRSTAREVESACQTTYAAMVASTSGSDRSWALDAMARSAVRSLRFGSAPEDFPGR